MRLIIFKGSKENHKLSQRNSFIYWSCWLYKLVETLSNIDQSKEYAQLYSILSFCLVFKLYNDIKTKTKKKIERKRKREKRNMLINPENDCEAEVK